MSNKLRYASLQERLSTINFLCKQRSSRIRIGACLCKLTGLQINELSEVFEAILRFLSKGNIRKVYKIPLILYCSTECGMLRILANQGLIKPAEESKLNLSYITGENYVISNQ